MVAAGTSGRAATAYSATAAEDMASLAKTEPCSALARLKACRMHDCQGQRWHLMPDWQQYSSDQTLTALARYGRQQFH